MEKGGTTDVYIESSLLVTRSTPVVIRMRVSRDPSKSADVRTHDCDVQKTRNESATCETRGGPPSGGVSPW